MEHSAERLANHTLTPALWRFFVVIWLAFLYYPMNDALVVHPTVLRIVTTLGGAALLVFLYLRLALPLPLLAVDAPLPVARLCLQVALLTLLATDVLLLTLFSSLDWLWFFIFVSIALGVRLPPRSAVGAIAGLSLLALVVGWHAFGWLFAFRIVLPVAVVGLGMIGVGWLMATIRELHAAREELARLAVAEERLRFARDLHDLLGHSLSTITLKNELARSLVPRRPDRAIQELTDAISVARSALREARSAVGGYRQPTLALELRNARALLETAGIACRIEVQPFEQERDAVHAAPRHDANDVNCAGALPPAQEAVLAWAVREGVTNVVRHSGARKCTIRVWGQANMATVEVRDDGRGFAAPAVDNGHSTDPGSGLRGLAERAARAQGQFEMGANTPTGSRLRVAVPLAGAPTAESSLQGHHYG